MGAYLVTGGAGFIGSHIVEELLQRGSRVRVLDDFSSGKKGNLLSVKDRIDLIEGDIRDISTCARAVKDIDIIFHQAAMTSVPGSVEEPGACNAVNVSGTLNMLMAAREAGVKRMVFASSSSIYGDEPALPNSEDVLGIPQSPYAVSKRTGEIYCQMYTKLFGFSTVCLRYFNVFGPRQDPQSQYAAAIPIFITRMLEGLRPVVYGDGEQTRDFVFVRNVVEANLLASQGEDASGEVMNIAGGERITINSLVESIGRILGTQVDPEYVTERPGDIRHSYASIAKAGEKLNFKTLVAFEEGLRQTIRWYQMKNGH
jgi:nucleoside-diphosphate-sugar epimerase